MGTRLHDRSPHREPVEIPEPVPQAARAPLAGITAVRKQRLGRLEIECSQARQAWRSGRHELCETKLQWRSDKAAASEFWQQEKRRYFALEITTGEFRKARAGYDRMKADAARRLLTWREQLAGCKERRHVYFEKRKQVQLARLQLEKLGLLREALDAELMQEPW